MFNTKEGYSLSDIAAVTRGENDGFGFGGTSGWWIILLFLFAFGGWGNGGFGWGGGNGAANVTADIGYNFDMHDISDEVRDLQASTSNGFRDLSAGMTNGFYNLNTGLLTGFSGVQSQICNSEFNTLQAINGNTMSGMQNTNALQSQIASNSNALQAQIAADRASADLQSCQVKDTITAGLATLNYNLATEACADRAAVTTGVRDVIDNANNNTRQILDFLVQDRITALTTENQALKGQISQSEQNAYLINALRPVADPAYIVANPYTGAYGYSYGCGCSGYMG